MFAFATDFHGEGRDAVLDNLQHRAGVGGVSLAVVYHDSRDVFPHGPRRVRFMEPGVTYFRPDPRLYRGLALRPRPARLVEEIDVLADVVPAARERGMAVHAWTVYLHCDWAHDGSEGHCERNAFGDPLLTELCPANPGVRAYVEALTTDVARRGVSSILAESLHYHPLEHGYHHERYLVRIGPTTRFLLGLCLCEHCRLAASAWGCDGEAVARFVRDEVQRVLDGGPDDDGALDEEAVRSLAAGELGAFLDARAERVTSLAAAATQAASAEGVELTFMDASGAVKGYADGKPAGGPAAEIAWRLGVDLPAVASATGGLEAIAYAADPARVELDLRAYAALLPAGGRLCAAMRPTVPDCETPGNLAEKLVAARRLGAGRIDLYHYGLAPLTALDLVHDAVTASGRAPAAQREGRSGQPPP